MAAPGTFPHLPRFSPGATPEHREMERIAVQAIADNLQLYIDYLRMLAMPNAAGTGSRGLLP